jgi:F-type H+/Na+-transporting ATPase subunit alpha
MAEHAGDGGGRLIVVRAPVPLDEPVVERIAMALSHALGEDVRIAQRHDGRLHGMVIVVDERHEIGLDLDASLRELERKLAPLRERETEETLERYRTDAVHAIEQCEPGRLELRDTNLSRVMDGFRGDTVALRTRVDLDDDLIDRVAAKLTAAAGRPIRVEMHLEPRLESGAVLQIGEEQRIVLDTRYSQLAVLERQLAEARDTGLVQPDSAYDFLREAIGHSEPELHVEEVLETGTVVDIGDGIATVAGLKGVGSQELVEFEGGVYGVAFNLQTRRVGCILLGPEEDIREGSGVSRTGHLLKVPVGERLSGRILNALGQPIDGKGPIDTGIFRPAERKAPGIVERAPVDAPLQTGIKVIDALVPLGRGQRELIIGDRKIGKTTVAIDTILNQRDKGVFCVYASIGQKASSVARVVRTLEEYGAMEYTTVVVSLSDEQCAFRYFTPYTACAMGEYLMDEGKHALVVYDDLSKHAVTYREMSSLLKRPIGREAYPGDVFYVHSRLLERAARLSDEGGGGTLTALPIVETLAGDISAFIPTNVISICDGQIMLDAGLFNEGVRPAMDVGLSVSRVGGAAQTKATKRVAGRLRMDLAQYQEMAQFVKFGAEVDQATLDQLTRGERGREVLKQPQHSTMPMAQQVAILFAVTSGLIDEVPLTQVGEFETGFLAQLERQQPELLAGIVETGELSGAAETALTAAIESFTWEFMARSQVGRTAAAPTAAVESTEAERAVI